jgi:hypothetical protein
MTKKKKNEDKEREEIATAVAATWAKVLPRFKIRRMKSIDHPNDSLFYDRSLFFNVN